MKTIAPPTALIYGCILVMLSGCAVRKATQAEGVLFADGFHEKYWVFNQVVSQPNGDQHYCLLVTQSPSDGGKALSIFLSHWDSRDSSFRYGMAMAPQGIWSKTGRWPWIARLQAQGSDSTAADWRIFWNHRTFWMDGQFADAARTAFSLKGRFADATAYEPIHIYPQQQLDSPSAAPDDLGPHAQVLKGRSGQWRREQEKPAAGFMQGAVFDKMGELLQARDTKAIYWIQTRFPDGLENGFLLSLSTEKRISILSHYWYNPSGKDWGEVSTTQEVWETSDAWTSPHSRKKYDLGMHVTGGTYEYLIQPKGHAQEVQAGSRSFWMGAVELVDGGKSVPIAIGNMYIFTR